MTAMWRTTSTGEEEEDPVNASQNAELSFLNTVWVVDVPSPVAAHPVLDPSGRAPASQVDYLRTMAANTKPLMLCSFPTGAPRALGKIDDSLALFESRALVILRVG